ncbi:hypothetical protein [Croceimicrobium hydrocarbonivorans]|uniref:Uncharacterized protein n=1 Tax=Croceimicrobium hydrocarbonivorans TaxID=2761580 RepID=A0A7H0VF22_9FLAO|nr:hypothetical protein [Croceimicrobium hydrocarbonivorans]QNR24320.1 hypothetical protein H4K34_00345 [Croceimicrobium hydrocarbonivorans]
MRKVQCILGFLLFSTTIWGQGFIRDLIIPEVLWRGNWNFYDLQYGRNEGELQLWIGHDIIGYNRKVYQYYPAQNSYGFLKTAAGGPSGPAIQQYQLNKICIWDGAGGGYSSRPYWKFWDLNSGIEREFYPNHRAASFTSFRNDSVFILYAKPNFNLPDFSYNRTENDTNTQYYLCYLNPQKQQAEILDSLRVPFYLDNADLHFDSRSNNWIVLFEDWYISFKKGGSEPDTIFQDPRLSLDHFIQFSAVGPEEYRKRFYQDGITWIFFNPDSNKVVSAFFSPTDTLYYDYSEILEYADFDHYGELGDSRESKYTGSLASLGLRNRATGIRDIMISRDDYWLFFRFEDSKITHFQKIARAKLPNAFFRAVLSTSKGGFYIGANRLTKGLDGKDSLILIYLDPQGRTSVLQPGEAFNLHYDSQNNQLKIFYPKPEAKLKYRIIDASGRAMQEGDFTVYEGLSLGPWQAAVYYLQLWEEDGNYIGQQSFLKSN